MRPRAPGGRDLCRTPVRLAAGGDQPLGQDPVATAEVEDALPSAGREQLDHGLA